MSSSASSRCVSRVHVCVVHCSIAFSAWPPVTRAGTLCARSNGRIGSEAAQAAVKGHFAAIPRLASAAAALGRFRPSLPVALVDTLLERLVSDLVTAAPPPPQGRLARAALLAHLYNYSALKTQHLFAALDLLVAPGALAVHAGHPALNVHTCRAAPECRLPDERSTWKQCSSAGNMSGLVAHACTRAHCSRIRPHRHSRPVPAESSGPAGTLSGSRHMPGRGSRHVLRTCG